MTDDTPSSPVLFSTVTCWKYYIQREYRNDTHFVWCSESFDPKKRSDYEVQSQIGPTSNPRSIYEGLQEAVAERDTHYEKIQEQKSLLIELATKWEEEGKISESEALQIMQMMEKGDFSKWRPLLYVIPTHLVADRVKLVPYGQRASLGPEWKIEELDGGEFSIVEI